MVNNKKRFLKSTIVLALASFICLSFSACNDNSATKNNNISLSLDDSSKLSAEVSSDDSSEISEEASSDDSSEISEEASSDESSEISEEASSDDSSEISEEASSDDSSEISEEASSDESSEISEEAKKTIDSAKEKFAHLFTDGEIIKTDNSYQSANVNITLKEITFGEKIFFVQDIYIKNIECLSSGFAGVKHDTKYNDYVFDMVEDHRDAGYPIIGAINGDYCGLDGKGAVIRNGILYGTGKAEGTVCVLYKNGIMKIIPPENFNAEKEIEKGAWQVWDFGPSFLDKDGSALSTFTERVSIEKSNPRTVIGYFEPGHYCFITMGGRASGNASGVTFKQMADFANSLGCTIAYNLDGGQSAVMVFGEKISNEKFQGTGRKITDIVFIQDIE